MFQLKTEMSIRVGFISSCLFTVLAGCVDSGNQTVGQTGSDLSKVDSVAPYTVADSARTELAKQYAELREKFIEIEPKLTVPGLSVV